MRRVVLVLGAMALALLLASGVALAVTELGGPGDDTLVGTKGSDTLVGRGGSDRINGRAGKDVVVGGTGNDRLLNGDSGADFISGGPGADFLVDGPIREFDVDKLGGGDGNDILVTWNIPVARDIVGCGDGGDFADVDRRDVVGGDCEEVRIRF